MSSWLVSLAGLVAVNVLVGVVGGYVTYQLRRNPMLLAPVCVTRPILYGITASVSTHVFFSVEYASALALGFIAIACCVSNIADFVTFTILNDDWWGKGRRKLKKLGKAMLDKLASLAPPRPMPAPVPAS